MARVRPLSQLDDVIGQLGLAAGRAAGDVVGPKTIVVRDEVRRQGRRYSLRGANGDPVVLSAGSNVRGTGQRRVGFVRGNPAGFWRIVEEGRSGGYLVAGRYRSQRGIGPRRRKSTTKGRFRSFVRDGGELQGFSPVNIPGIGYRQFAIVRRGHGSIGRPWRQAMDRAEELAARKHYEIVGRQLGKVWRG